MAESETRSTTGHTWTLGRCQACGIDAPRPWAETCQANPPGVSAELSLALRQAARAHLRLDEGDYWPSGLAASQATFLLSAGWRVIPPTTTPTPAADESGAGA